MILPDDWDKPGKENRKLCRKFEYASYSNDGITLPYRLFRADAKEPVPLVMYLHGADAVGTDNKKQLKLHDIGTMFAKQKWQEKHPCHIAAPQYDIDMHWSKDDVAWVFNSLVDKLCHDLNVDIKRLYIYGYSAGGVGTLKYLKDYPGKYAGAIAICGAVSVGKIEELKKTPLWMIHASDDNIVKATYMEPGLKKLYHYGSRDVYEKIGNDAENLKYTELPGGYMADHYGVNPHCSWVEVSDDNNFQYREWLFQQKNDG